MSTAIGTTCAPLGLTMDFGIQDKGNTQQVPYTSGGNGQGQQKARDSMRRHLVAVSLGTAILAVL